MRSTNQALAAAVLSLLVGGPGVNQVFARQRTASPPPGRHSFTQLVMSTGAGVSLAGNNASKNFVAKQLAGLLQVKQLLTQQEFLIKSLDQLETIRPINESQRKAYDRIDDQERALMEKTQDRIDDSLAKLGKVLKGPLMLEVYQALKSEAAAIGRQIDAIEKRPDPFDRPAGTRTK